MSPAQTLAGPSERGRFERRDLTLDPSAGGVYSARMPSPEEWREVTSRIRAGDVGAFRALYQMATEDGRALLRARYAKTNPADHEDLIHDVLATAQDRIVEAENPRGMFIVCLANRTVDFFRRAREKPLGDELPEIVASSNTAARLDLQRALEELTVGNERDAQIYYAIAVLGEDADVVARAYGLTRDNAYQIVSRTKKRLKGGTP